MADNDKMAIPPPSFQISRQMDQEKIDVLTKRIEELIAINNKLRSSAEKNEKDKQDIYLYYQRELEMKDDIIARLNEELIKRENQSKQELDRLKRKHEQELYDLRKESVAENEYSKNRCTQLESELSLLDAYKRDKEYHDRKLAELELAIKQHNKALFDQQETLDRKFLNIKAQLIKEHEEQKEAFKDAAIRDARQNMDLETRKVMADNRRMMEELKFHNAVTEELQQEKVRLESALELSKREVSLLTQKEEEYSKQSALRAREIKALKESVHQLETSQGLNLERFRQRAKELQNTVHKELEDATLDASGLRRLLKVKNKELRQIKRLAATILEQRSEVEQFFLEALAEVKDKIRQQSRRSATEAVRDLNQLRGAGVRGGTGSTFPAIKPTNLDILQPKTRPTVLQKTQDKVFMSELSWEDKETVLRMLFGRINGLQSSAAAAATSKNPHNLADRVFLTQSGAWSATAESANSRAGAEGSPDGGGGVYSTGGSSKGHTADDYLARLEAAFPTNDENFEDEDGEVVPGLLSMVGLA